MMARKNLYDPDKWDDDERERFDKKVSAAASTLLTALHLRQTSIYEPSALVVTQLALIGSRNLETELGALPDQGVLPDE
jgi:hypothetical protein